MQKCCQLLLLQWNILPRKPEPEKPLEGSFFNPTIIVMVILEQLLAVPFIGKYKIGGGGNDTCQRFNFQQSFKEEPVMKFSRQGSLDLRLAKKGDL